MDDNRLIKVGVAKALINKELWRPTDEFDEAFNRGMKFAIRLLDDVPTANSVEHVVRCPNCVYHTRCITEDYFIHENKEPNRRFCGDGKGLSNSVSEKKVLPKLQV